jgi:DNA-binding transcriptional MerR regulator
MEKTEKLFYSIGEVSEMLELNPSAIRYYIKEFHLKVERNKKGNLMFRQKDIDKIKQILVLTKESGYTLSGAKEQLKSKKNKSLSKEEIQNLKSKLMEIRNKLEQIKKSL